MGKIEDGLGPKRAQDAGVKGGVNVGGGGNASDLKVGEASTNVVGGPRTPHNGEEPQAAQPQAGADAQATQAFGRRAQQGATAAAQKAFGPANADAPNVYQAARGLMGQRAAYQFARGGDVDTHGLYKALHSMGYKTDGKNVLGLMSDPNALSGLYDRLVEKGEAKANQMVRAGTQGAKKNVPTAQEVADQAGQEAAQKANAPKKSPTGVTMAKAPPYAQGGANGANETPWIDVDGASVQLAGVDTNDPAAVQKARQSYLDGRAWMTEGGYYLNA